MAQSFRHKNPFKGNRYHELRQSLLKLTDEELSEEFQRYQQFLQKEDSHHALDALQSYLSERNLAKGFHKS